MDLLPEDLRISVWDEVFAVRAGLGYDDNILLSDADKEGSGFGQIGLDAAVLRLPITDPWDLSFFLTGYDRRYWAANLEVNHEDEWTALAKARRDLGDGWTAGGSFSYNYIYQVVDIFDFVNLATPSPPVPLEAQTLMLRPEIEKDLGGDWTLRLEVEATQAFVSEPGDSFFRLGPILTLERAYTPRSSFSLSYSAVEYFYEHETDLDSNGDDTTGGSLRALKQTFAFASKHYWDNGQRWQTTGQVAYSAYRDNGSGYYNFDDYSASAGLRYNDERWELSGSGSIEYVNFPIQTVNGPGTPQLHQTLVTADARVSRHLLKSLLLFVDYNLDMSLSDSPDQVWHANTVNGGLEYEF